MDSATIVSASLSDKELRDSVTKLVNYFDDQMKIMAVSANITVDSIEKKLKSLGNIKIDSGGTADGGSSRRTKLFSQEGEVIQRNNQIAKEYNTTLDQQAAAIRKASQVSVRTGDAGSIRNADTLQTMNIQLDLLRERLREARNQYSSFVALASHATTTGDKGLYQFATEGVHKYEQEVRSLIPQIRGMQSAISQFGDVIAPQGHTIQNYVNSLQKANPELAALNGQFKRGKSLLQQQKTEYEQNSQAQRNLVGATNQQNKTLDEMNAYMRLNIQREQERRNAILQTGSAAREATNQLIKSAHEQASSQSNLPISGTKELAAAVEQMRRAYFEMSASDRISPLGRALEEDIKRANEAITVIRKYNQSLVGLQHEEKYNITNASTLESLRQSLKGLTDQYNKLTVAQINAGKGDALIQHFQDTTRAAQILQKTLNRPVSLKAALSGDERTLDDMAYKMQRLRAYKQGIDLTKPNAANEIKQVDEALIRLQKDMDKYLSKSKDVLSSNNALGRSWNYMKNRLAFYFTVGASTQFVKNLIEVRSQYEMNERALGILINSAERGTQIFKELSQMALVSPYTLIELSNAAKQLTAYDIAAKDVVDTTRRLADMASAVGVPMERLTYALGQIKAYGYLNSRDARMFANAGIPLVRELSKYYSELEGKVVSVGDVYDRMKKKAIDYNSVMAVVTKMTDEGGKFFDFQAKMANTLKVQLANLSLAWNNMLNDMGASEQGVLTGGIAALKNLFLHWKDIESTIKKVVVAFGLFKAAQFTALAFMGDLTSAMAWQTLVGKRLQTTFVSLTSSIKASSLAIGAAGAAFWMILAEGIVTYMKNAEEVERLNQSISDGAKEAAKNLNEFLESAEIEQAKLSAQTGKLPKSEAEKTWDALREQIELSSASANDIIPKLLEISDLNSRLTLAFDLAERIKKANENLGDLNNTLDFTQDTILGGLFGEGVVEDIEDYNEHLAYASEETSYLAKKNHSFFENAAMGIKSLFNNIKEDLGSSTEEAENEIVRFAHSAAKTIKDELGEEGLKDSVQINEAISRVLKGFEQQFPQIKGKGKMLFETIFNDVMAQEFNGAVDKQAYYYKLFLERLKKDHASAFQGVTDDILKETHRWSSGQQDAIKKTAEKVKTDLPLAAQDAIDQILSQLNKTDFKLRIVTEFATTTLDDVQKQFKDKFINKPWIEDQKEREKAETEAQQKYGNLMRKTTESNVEYEKRVSDERKKQLELSKKNLEIISANKNKQDALSKAIVKDAQEQEKAANDWLKAAKEVEDAGGYDFSTKNENAAASKAQKAAETELQKALKDELQLIDKVRSQYKKLTDAGATDGEALVVVTNQFANSLKHVNSVLGKNGIPLFDITKFAGTDNPNALLDMLKLQLDSAKVAKNIKPEEIKELEVKYSEIVVDAKAYNLTKITKGLNNELDRLKDEYELAVSLDADPELGNMFADWMGIDVNDLPRTASEYAERASKILNNKLKDLGAKTELPSVLNITDDDMRAFEENKVFTDKQLELVKKAVEAARGFQKKETEERIKDWDKLLEKYAEYETKVNKIQNDAVKERVTFAQQFGNDEEKSLALNLQTQILAATDPQEKQKLIQQLQELVKSIAGDDKAKLNIVTSINTGETRNLAKASFEEFQKSPEWITATGELSGMTNKAINGLIASLEKYKKSAKNLDPKQIKNINNALKNLYKEQRKNNPFGAIANMIDKAKERMTDVEPEMESIMSDIIALEKEIGDGEATEEQVRHIEDLKERWKTLSEVGKISASEWVESLMSVYGAIKGAIGLVDELAKAVGGKEGSDIERVFGVLDKAGQGAQIGATFGEYGAAIGAVAGAATGFIKEFSDEFTGNSDINTNVKQSTINVKRLQTALKDLEYEIEKVGGTGELTLRKIAIASREWQLAELKRQLALEESRTSKNRDEERIEDLRSQIKDLELDLKRAADEIVNDFLGISSVGDAAENMMDAFISALRSGEDAMASFNESINDMIANMLKKLLVTKILEPKIQEIWDKIQSDIDERTKSQASELSAIEEFSNRGTLDFMRKRMYDALPFPDKSWLDGTTDEYKELWEKMFAEYENSTGKSALDKMGRFTKDFTQWFLSSSSDYMGEYKKRLEHELANAWTAEDLKVYAEELRSLSPEMQDAIDYVNQLIKELGLEESSQQSLSALQQGIQGITETTAGALEAYMNGVSQQVYYQSDLLTQIRDAVVLFNTDVQVATMGQILLQLQNSYLVQTAIQNILNGWSSPNGLAVRVEMS